VSLGAHDGGPAAILGSGNVSDPSATAGTARDSKDGPASAHHASHVILGTM
jgi:hypothetical protein